jgi:hypothetical protein
MFVDCVVILALKSQELHTGQLLAALKLEASTAANNSVHSAIHPLLHDMRNHSQVRVTALSTSHDEQQQQ